jgi:hypothetical protein
MRLSSFVFVVWVSGAPDAAAKPASPLSPDQNEAPGQSVGGRLRVYLDCGGDCFETFLRDEIPWVDFVRQPQDADVHVLSSSNETGGGGREVVIRFVGGGRFVGADNEYRALSLPAEPENTRRANVLRTVEVGLLNYLAREGLPADLTLRVGSDEERRGDLEPTSDAWRLWFFRATGGASLEAEETNREVRWDAGLTADRVTEDWKVAFGAFTSRQRERFDLDEEDPIEVIRREASFESFVAKGLGPHWSVGLHNRLESSTFGNTRFEARASPTVEFSIFPYREYATRQFVLQYEAGVQHATYYEITLFNRLEETLGRHEMSMRFDQRQPWGSMETAIEWSQYLHDFSKYRLEVEGELSVRLLRGLSVDFDGSVSRIRDQLSLPRRTATPEEVLLEIRELQSGYDVSFATRLSYSFGSIFNNVVNPRFD